MTYVKRGFFWITVYLCLVLTPLFILLLTPGPPGSGFWWDFSIALGFAGAAMMGTMFVLTARFRYAAAPFGIDIIYYFHRWIGVAAFIFILAHPLIIFIIAPDLLRIYLDPSFISWPMWAGVASLAALTALVIVSLGRKQLGIHYDGWRLSHAILASAALLLTFVHIAGISVYVASPWKRILWATITICWLSLLLYVRLIKPLLLLKRPYMVEQVVKERGHAWTITLRPKGHKGFTFMPGQFAWMNLSKSPLIAREHPFSFSGSAEETETLQFTIKELGDFTRTIKNVSPGQIAYLDGPFGAFTIDRHPSANYVFIGGGIGIAPIMSMLKTLTSRKDKRPLLLFYAYNNWENLTFQEELETLKTKLNLKVVYILKNPPDNWQEERGFITDELLSRRLPLKPEQYEYYLCGPNALVSISEKSLRKQGVPLARIHSELFDLA